MLTEDTLKSLSTPESFARGKRLFKSEAIYDTFKQGSRLSGKCEDSSAPFYEVRLQIDEGGIQAAACTCPYDRGGYCKHIIALALAWMDRPDGFVEQKTIAELLEPLDKPALVSLIGELAEKDVDVYPWLQTAVSSAASLPTHEPQPKRKTQVSKTEYARQIRGILHSLRGYRRSEAYWMVGGIVDQLNEIQASAFDFLNAGDATGALVIFTTLFSEVHKNYGEIDDSDGLISGFCVELALPMTEAILSAEISRSERRNLFDTLQPIIHDFGNYGIENLDFILAALNRGWSGDYLDELEDYDCDERLLAIAKLNVLERQNRLDEFLSLCLDAGEYRRYILKLVEFGEIEDALRMAEKTVTKADEALTIARKLRDTGCLDGAMRLAERGLALEGSKSSLGEWLGPIEEARGRVEQAILAYRAAFSNRPTLELYRTLERLSGQGWPGLKKELEAEIQSTALEYVQVDIYLYEKDWDAAIGVADQIMNWQNNVLEKVATTVLPYRPDWVIQVCQKIAEGLIAKTQTKYYKTAVKWLGLMKKAYFEKGKEVEWHTYLLQLKVRYARRPSLQAELMKL